MQAPGLWVWGQENKIYACMMVFFFSNMIENQCMSTGAFEITLNDVPVWSKLESVDRDPNLLFEVGVFTGREKIPMKVCATGRIRRWLNLYWMHSVFHIPSRICRNCKTCDGWARGDCFSRADGNGKQPSPDGEIRVTREETETGAGGGSGQKRRKIGVYFCGPTPLLWQAAEVKVARETGVVGTLVGSLARQPRQNNRLGRPLELLQEEARLLRETGQAVCPASARANSQGVKEYLERVECNYEEQRALALQDRKAMVLRALTRRSGDADGTEPLDQNVRDRLDALERGFSFPRSAMAVQLNTAKAGLGHDPEERNFWAADWPQHRDERSETRFRVFRDLRRQGFYLTSAGKFGGDYLVYPGDPLRFHAHFIAVCVPMDTPTPLCDLLALSRLGANVKKTILLCSPGDDDDEGGEKEDVVYTSLQWSGMV
ncbi:hypothetical protein AAFF_G00186120 [Aldrovandia affinis]|uniref:tRNA-splicing endonuclease subunit SEN34 n=1 Tax=Aldrovandia affinis TaxID=143900 RepID=A0AAD7WVM2_9TELE|nr:hypothetical protein AAFF_G00186120 [Aldrovandia affinis]